jgi:hypothetical protein
MLRILNSNSLKRFEIFIMIKMSIVVFWVLMLRGLVDGYQCFGGTVPEDGNDSFLQNISNHLQNHTVPQPRKPQSTFISIYILTWSKWHSILVVDKKLIFHLAHKLLPPRTI